MRRLFIAALLVVALIQGGASSEQGPTAPTEYECRPHIEKALAGLGTTETNTEPEVALEDGGRERRSLPDNEGEGEESSMEIMQADQPLDTDQHTVDGGSTEQESQESTEQSAESAESLEPVSEGVITAEAQEEVAAELPVEGESLEQIAEGTESVEASSEPSDEVTATEPIEAGEVTEQTSEESTEQAAEGAVEQSSEDSTEQAAEGEVAAQSSEESTEQAAEGAVEQSTEDSTEQAAEGAVEQSAEESTEQAAGGEITEQSSEESTEQAAGGEITEQSSEESTEQVAEGAVEQSSEESTEKVVEENTAQAAEGETAEQSSEESTEEVAEGSTVQAAEGDITEQSSEESTEQATEGETAEQSSAESTEQAAEGETAEQSSEESIEQGVAEGDAAAEQSTESGESTEQATEGGETTESAEQTVEGETKEGSSEGEVSETEGDVASTESTEAVADVASTESTEAVIDAASTESTETVADEASTESTEAVPDAAEVTDEVVATVAEEEEPEPMPEEELSFDMIVPDNLRPRDHIASILKLDEESIEDEILLSKTVETTLKELKRFYDSAIKPLEILYKYRDLSNRHFGDPEIFSKPLILFMGPWSGGKSSIINYLLDNEYKRSSLRTGAEPSPAYFNLVMWGEKEEVLDGTQLAADWTFSGLQKFGQGLLDRLRGLRLNNRLLEKVNIVEIPGILEIRKQVERLFPFNDACQWFIDRADIIFLVYDPSKLDVGPETEAILDQLKGREYQTRILLNKADQVHPEELMRVQGTLIWNISPLMSSTQPPVMYSTSLWSNPYELGAPLRLLRAQERAFLRDMREAIDKRVENKIASARRFAVRVRNHAKMVDCYLTTYYNHKSFFGNRKKVSDDIIEKPQDYHIYEGLSTLTNISRYDLPDPETYRDFFKVNPLYEFELLSATCTYFKGCPINRLDIAIAYELPELLGKYKKSAEAALAKQEPGGKS